MSHLKLAHILCFEIFCKVCNHLHVFSYIFFLIVPLACFKLLAKRKVLMRTSAHTQLYQSLYFVADCRSVSIGQFDDSLGKSTAVSLRKHTHILSEHAINHQSESILICLLSHSSLLLVVCHHLGTVIIMQLSWIFHLLFLANCALFGSVAQTTRF